MVKALLLGKGFVGKKLGAYLIEQGVDIFHIAQNEIDYTSHYTFSTLLRDYNFTHIINCCGYTGKPNVDSCETNKDECWKYNVTVAEMIDRLSYCFGKRCIHISSGCVYTGYEKEYTEQDTPNFGLYNPESSFYSKSKHALETVIDTKSSAILRIRMPYTGIHEDKNYLIKILKYDNLISMPNSVTSIDDFCIFVSKFVNDFKPGIYNVVNPQPIESKEIVNILQKYNLVNVNWKFIEVKDLNVIANRSNCVLNTDKIKSIGLCLPDTRESIERSIKSLCS